MKLERADIETAKARAAKYLENYYIHARDAGGVTEAYTLGDMLICVSRDDDDSPKPALPSLFDVFNFRRDGADALAELLKPGDRLFVYSDADIEAEMSCLLERFRGTKKIYLLKEGGGAPYDPDVERLPDSFDAEVEDFLDLSQEAEEIESEEWWTVVDLDFNVWRHWLGPRSSDDGEIFCIRQDGKIAGICYEEFYRNMPNKATGAIYISRQYRGRGLGKRLLRATLTRDGYSYQYSCNAENAASLKTALSLGYRISGYMYWVEKQNEEHEVEI